jgi:molybdopterin biosynthesis enzyme
LDYLQVMTTLVPLDLCLAGALDGVAPVVPSWVATADAVGRVLAQDLRFPCDMPQRTQALRAGYAVAALDLVGASVGTPVPLMDPVRVLPGDMLFAGMDAVLPEDGLETGPGWAEAIRPLNPGEGVRRAGHDGQAGELLAPASTRLTPRHNLIAAQAGITQIALRQPRVALELADPAQRAFARDWCAALGAVVVDGPADLTFRTTTDHTPRLALVPAETAWLARADAELVLTVPVRFDAMLAAFLALALPALARLSGASVVTKALPLARKLTSTVGLSELVLLTEQAGQWHPQPAGVLTLSGLARATAFAILPPDSEGMPALAPLSATPIDLPFG